MAKGKLILICHSGGAFVTKDDGTMFYNGGEANATNVTSETPFNDLKLNLAETCNLNQETVTVKYFLPGNKRNLITVKNDKDVRRMVDFHGDAITTEVFVTGTPGFNRSALEMPTNRQNPMKNHEDVDNDMTTKKDENLEQGKARTKKSKKMRKEDEVAKSPEASSHKKEKELSKQKQNPMKNHEDVDNDNLTTKKDENAEQGKARRKKGKKLRKEDKVAKSPEASSHKKEKELPKQRQKQKIVSSDDKKSESSTSDSSSRVEVNVNADSDCGSDRVLSRGAKRKKVSPADGAKKRKRTPTWKVGANGCLIIVSDYVGAKSKGGSGNEKSQTKSDRLAAKGDYSPETKSGRKRRRPRAIDDMSPETLVSLWKSAITGVGQQFTNVHEFLETLRRYAIANDFKFKLKKNDNNRAIGKCSSEGCSWKFNAAWVRSTKSFTIKTMKNVHTCDTESKNWLLDTIKEKLQDSPHLKPKEVANGLLKDFGFKSKSNHKQKLQRSDKDWYSKLPWFCEKIKVTNPGSILNLVVDENKRFKALFVSFYASLCGFQNSCRPLVFLEATSLRSVYGEEVFIAYAIDGNDNIFPVAFAVVDDEDDNNWHWFLEQLKAAIYNYQPITFVFDRDKNLKPYIVKVFQDSHVGYSMYHLLQSFKRNVKAPFHGDSKSFLLNAAHAVRLGGFKKSTEEIKQLSPQAYDWVMQIEPQHWTTWSFEGERYNHIIDDVSRPLCKLMEDYQELPILHKIDAIIRTMIDNIDDARLHGSMLSTHLTPLKEKQLLEEIVKSCGLKVLISSDTLFEVREDLTHVVNIGNWSCTCLRWKETGLPCRHALAVFASTGKNLYDFCSTYFTADAYRLTYMESIIPVPIDKDGEGAGGENEQALAVTDKEDCEKEEVGKDEGVLVLPPICTKLVLML